MRLTALADEQAREIAAKLRQLGWRFDGVSDDGTWRASFDAETIEADGAAELLAVVRQREGLPPFESTRSRRPEIQTGLPSR